MTYEYACLQCRHRFDVIKSVKDIERSENCPQCGEFAERKFVPSRLYLAGTSVEHAEYNPGLGQIVKNKQHKKEICKRMGVVEVGNDFRSSEGIHKHFDSERKAKRARLWEKDE